jgi:glycosyltransferase involved in cell wall biosynthesis
MKHNILYLHEAAEIGGGENSLLNLVDNIDKDKFNVVFACPGKGAFPDRLRERGIAIHPIIYPQVRTLIGVPSTVGKLCDIIEKDGISLIHSNSIRTHLYAAIAGRLKKIPVVWHERNLITNEIIDPDKLLSFLPDSIVCNSRAIAERFISSGKMPGKVIVIHNGVNTGVFNPLVSAKDARQKIGIGPEETVIGIASRFNTGKGHETFLKAAKIVCSDLQNGPQKVRFLVVGSAVFEEDKKREKYLAEFTRTLGISDKVIFTGFIDKMADMYAAMDIFVLASFAEPCGRVIFEAMAMGKPVVATNTGGTPEIVVDGVTGILVKPKDPGAMAYALKDLVRDKIKRISMGAEARKRIEDHFSIQKNVERTEELYEELLAKRGLIK